MRRWRGRRRSEVRSCQWFLFRMADAFSELSVNLGVFHEVDENIENRILLISIYTYKYITKL